MKLCLLYYKNLLDAAVEKLFASIGSMFTKLDDGTYVFSSGWSKSKMSKLFEQCLKESMLEVVEPATKTHDKYIIIGSCWPIDNLLLTWKDRSYFPKKLEALIMEKPTVKYLLREKDICVDIDALNEIFLETFNKMFKDGYVAKLLGKSFSNVICVSHSFLDCYAVFKTIKWAYGSSSCINVWKEKMHTQMQHLVAVNELIAKYIQKKTLMNNSLSLKKYAREVKDYLREKIGA